MDGGITSLIWDTLDPISRKVATHSSCLKLQTLSKTKIPHRASSLRQAGACSLTISLFLLSLLLIDTVLAKPFLKSHKRPLRFSVCCTVELDAEDTLGLWFHFLQPALAFWAWGALPAPSWSLRPQEAAGEGDLQVTDRCSWVTQLSWLTGLESWPRTFFHRGWHSLICESSFSLLILDVRQWYVNMKANTGYAERNLTFLFLSVTSWFWDCSLSLPFLNSWHFLCPEGNILWERLVSWMPCGTLWSATKHTTN